MKFKKSIKSALKKRRKIMLSIVLVIFISFRNIRAPFHLRIRGDSWAYVATSTLRCFPSFHSMYGSKRESRIRGRRGGECPDKTVRVLGNKRAMHLWDLNRLSGPFPRLCIIHQYLAVPWMFYALALLLLLLAHSFSSTSPGCPLLKVPYA